MLTELTHPVTALKEPVVLTTKDSKSLQATRACVTTAYKRSSETPKGETYMTKTTEAASMLQHVAAWEANILKHLDFTPDEEEDATHHCPRQRLGPDHPEA